MCVSYTGNVVLRSACTVRSIGQSINNILIKIFKNTNKKAEKICKTFAEIFRGTMRVRNPI